MKLPIHAVNVVEAKYCKDNLFYCNKHGKKTQYKIPEKAIKTVEKMKKKIYSLYVIL